MATIRKCVCCGKDYKFMRNDGAQWKTMFCGDKCKAIFETASAYAFNDIDNEKAKAKLKTLGVTDNRSCPSGVASALKSLFEINPKYNHNKNDK